MLYGEGDFKKSVLNAIKCGDDTDCTGATVGALFGILGGQKIIPLDWKEYIGEKIVTVSIDRGTCYTIPNNCVDLADRVILMAPIVLKANNASAVIYDGENYFEKAEKLYTIPGLSFYVDFGFANAQIIYDKIPKLKPNEQIHVTVKLKTTCFCPFYNARRLDG